MGGMADYAGSLVLQMPVEERAKISLAVRNDTIIRTHVQPYHQSPVTEIVSSKLLKPDGSVDVSVAQATGQNQWLSVILTSIGFFFQARHLPVTGLDIWVEVSIPARKGLAAEAALSLAVIQALAQAHAIRLNETEAAFLAWEAQRLINPHASLADYFACESGKPHQLLPVLCQPGHTSAPVSLPPGICLVHIDTGIEQPVPHTAYEHLRIASLIGYSMIALSDGTYPHELEVAQQTQNREHLLYNGYLANITPLEFEDRYQWLPAQVKGNVFLEKSGILLDDSATVDPETLYPVLQAVRHPIYENIRVQYFSLLLQHLPPATDAQRREKSLFQLGTWMKQSHESYIACGLSHPHVDALVQELTTRKGVYGARLTDQGGGGTVCVLCDDEQGLEAVAQVQASYQNG